MLAVSTLVVLAGLVLIEPIFGAAFDDALTPLLLLARGMVRARRGYTASQMLLGRGEGRAASRVMLATLMYGLACWVPATWLWGIEGAALGTSIAYLLQAILTRAAILGEASAAR